MMIITSCNMPFLYMSYLRTKTLCSRRLDIIMTSLFVRKAATMSFKAGILQFMFNKIKSEKWKCSLIYKSRIGPHVHDVCQCRFLLVLAQINCTSVHTETILSVLFLIASLRRDCCQLIHRTSRHFAWYNWHCAKPRMLVIFSKCSWHACTCAQICREQWKTFHCIFCFRYTSAFTYKHV